MHIKFNQIRLSNFLSMGNATLDLNAGGYTLVNGINQSPDDNAASNGSGKSTLFDAISYALTGETIRGSKDVVNIHGTDGALVELDFTVDGNEYKIIRTKDHSKYKTNLKFFVNSEDKSGKGIKDTTKILSEYLPDLTSSLLGSVIILGQGLPQRFSNNSPSGRKEVLEELSKSDFMLSDLKNRVSNRQSIIKTEIRKQEDICLTNSSQISLLETQIQTNQAKLEGLDSADNLTATINDLDEILNTENDRLTQLTEQLDSQKQEQTKLLNIYNGITKEQETDKSIAKAEAENQISQIQLEYKNKITEVENRNSLRIHEAESKWATEEVTNLQEQVLLDTQCKNLQADITKLQNIKDVCPTCGQKLPNVTKPDTTELEKQLEELTSALAAVTEKIYSNKAQAKQELDELNGLNEGEKSLILANMTAKIDGLNKKLTEDLIKIEQLYSEQATQAKQDYDTVTQQVTQLETEKNSLTANIQVHRNLLTNTKTQLASLESTKTEAENAIETAKQSITELKEINVKAESDKLVFEKHLEILNKMSNVLSRDFRGFLLTNVIEYIDRKAKEYSMDLFNTDKIEFVLEGNNIVIKYDNKELESLSGGEKQKIDIIIQFALRDMLCQYLNFSSNLLVLDEIADNIDSYGAEQLFNMISKRLVDVQDIFIISHHVDFCLPCDRQITIIKDANKISRLEKN